AADAAAEAERALQGEPALPDPVVADLAAEAEVGEEARDVDRLLAQVEPEPGPDAQARPRVAEREEVDPGLAAERGERAGGGRRARVVRADDARDPLGDRPLVLEVDPLAGERPDRVGDEGVPQPAGLALLHLGEAAQVVRGALHRVRDALAGLVERGADVT